MRKRSLSSAVVLCGAGALAFGTPFGLRDAAGQTLCGTREGLGHLLAERFSEIPRAAGLSGDRIVELLSSDAGSWTILITTMDGTSCILTGGGDWIEKPAPVAPVEAPKGKGA